MLASLVFLTPLAALSALLGLVPLAALALAGRREGRARSVLGLPAPSTGGRLAVVCGIVGVALLLGLAAAQPVLRSTSSVAVRTDAEVYFVLDNSRSMLAARSSGTPTRIARARDEAIRLREELRDVPAGVATMNDHLLPHLLPSPDPAVFEQTVRRAVQVNEPPPASTAVTATTLGALAALGTQNYFAPSARKRLAIVLTDGESRPFDVQATARALARRPGVDLILVHVSSPDEAVYDEGGRPEQGYHGDPASGEIVAGLARATGGSSFGEGRIGAVAAAARAALGTGSTRPVGRTTSTTSLAPYAALAALLPLLLVVAGGRLPRLLPTGLRRQRAASVVAARPREAGP